MSNCPAHLYSCFVYTWMLNYIYLFTFLTTQYICTVQLIFSDRWSAGGLKKADQNESDESDDTKLNHLIYYLAFFLCLIVLFKCKSFAALLVFGNSWDVSLRFLRAGSVFNSRLCFIHTYFCAARKASRIVLWQCGQLLCSYCLP